MFITKDDAARSYGFVGADSDPCAELNKNNARGKREETSSGGAGQGSSSGGTGQGSSSGGDGPSDEQREQLAENLCRVDVYFETLSVQNIIETPTYDVSVVIILMTNLTILQLYFNCDDKLNALFVCFHTDIFVLVGSWWSSIIIPWNCNIHDS